MTWEYVENLKTKTLISDYEKQFGVKLPYDLVNVIVKYNGGVPNPSIYDTCSTKERIFGQLLTFNHCQSDIFDATEFLSSIGIKGFIPISIDPFGNYICLKIDDGKYYFLNMETLNTELISDSFSSLLENLYEVEK